MFNVRLGIYSNANFGKTCFDRAKLNATVTEKKLNRYITLFIGNEHFGIKIKFKSQFQKSRLKII